MFPCGVYGGLTPSQNAIKHPPLKGFSYRIMKSILLTYKQFIQRIHAAVVLPADDELTRIRKVSMVQAQLVGILFASLWGISFIALHYWMAALINLAFIFFVVGILIAFLLTHHFFVYVNLNIFVLLVWALALQSALGGMFKSGLISIWAAFCPLMASLMLNRNAITIWIILFVAEMVMAVFIEQEVAQWASHIPKTFSLTNGVINITSFTLLMVGTNLYLVSNLEDARKRLDNLLQRINRDLDKEKIRIEQEKNMWLAVGHEIRSPLQSLSALYGKDNEGHRYIKRMLDAVQRLYGNASPNEAFQKATIQVEPLNVTSFLKSVAENAPAADIPRVTYSGSEKPVMVQADESSLEDVITHILTNANRYRPSDTDIAIRLETLDNTAIITIHNKGPHIPDDLIGRIFEYGVSDKADAADQEHQGQGLFVAKTYMSKMSGTIDAKNVPDGVDFVLRLSVWTATDESMQDLEFFDIPAFLRRRSQS